MRGLYRLEITVVALLLTVGLSPAAFAQVDIAGSWAAPPSEDQPERVPGAELGDYLGLPINEAARQYADAWQPSRLTIPEHQCRAHVAPYILRGPAAGVRIWEERDSTTQDLIAIKMFINSFAQLRTIWMDGRVHPSDYAPRTWQGFSTGRWDGNALRVTTTHIKQGWIRRNGLPMSTKATVTEHLMRHGDDLTYVVFVQDPVFLEEPLLKTEHLTRNVSPATNVYQNWLSCQPDDEIDRPRNVVPHNLPGTNKDIAEFPARHRIPVEATRGGAATMYPEYQDKLRQLARSSRPSGR